ncbi:MAG: ankyrin repeat domain-containing protein [Chitinophagales bacterium]
MSFGGNWKEMFKAIQEGDFELVSYHINAGVDPNYQHPEYMALPLVESIRFNHLDIAKLLLENGANPNSKEVLGADSPLSVAKAKNNSEAIKLVERFL